MPPGLHAMSNGLASEERAAAAAENEAQRQMMSAALMANQRSSTSLQAAGMSPVKIPEYLERIREEYAFLQGQTAKFENECKQLSLEKTDIEQRCTHAISEQQRLNFEAAKQSEIAKRLHNLILQMVHYVPHELKDQLRMSVDRATNISTQELQVFDHLCFNVSVSISRAKVKK